MGFDIAKLDSFSTQPGVYMMKNRTGVVLYVGKAKNLRQRIKQYFLPGRDGRLMIPYLVSHIDHIDILVVFSEKEALLLENNLIKQHKPKYNAVLKDDKTYIAIKVTTKSVWPKAELVRYHGTPKADGVYFGPYTSAQSARETLDLLQRLFPLRQCSDQEFTRRTRPCILYDMHRCIAPCVGKCTEEEYDGHVKRMIQFLRGQNKDVLKELYTLMEQASDELEFEKAASILQTIRHLEKTIEEQLVDKPLGMDSDVIGIFREGEEVILALLFFRGGKLLGSRHYSFSKIVENDEELLISFLMQHYDQENEVPHEILLPNSVEEVEALEELLTSTHARKVSVLIPQRGDKRQLVEMAYENAKSAFTQQKDQKAIREKALLEMQEKFRLTRYPERIECLDISNLSGTEPVAAMIAFTDGEKETQRYRRYKIKTALASDDYGAMKEVLSRRYQRARDENDLPDLLIVDGGKGHLNMAMKVIQELNIISIDIIALAKEEGRHDKGMTIEQIFLPEMKDPILLKHSSQTLFLLQKIRDEAHRFAITFQRSRRNKKSMESALDTIPGIGPAKRKLLLKHFGSVKGILQASSEQLRQVPKLSEANIKVIEEFIKSKNGIHR